MSVRSLLIIQHSIFWPFDIVEITALDCPDEEKPGTGADAE
jgi:hypothetical protein